MTDADLIRKAMLDQASGIDGLEPTGSSPSPVWRYPYWPIHDVGYEEDEQ
jgi:hypothetical protein